MCWLDGWFRRGAALPRSGNPLVKSSRVQTVRHSGTRPLSPLSQLLPSSCILPRCCRYIPQYMGVRTCGSCPCPGPESPGHGPFLQDFFFLSPTSAFAMRAMPLRFRAAFFSLLCTCVRRLLRLPVSMLPPCPRCAPMAHAPPPLPQKSCNAGRTLIVALRHSHNTLARRLLAPALACLVF